MASLTTQTHLTPASLALGERRQIPLGLGSGVITLALIATDATQVSLEVDSLFRTHELALQHGGQWRRLELGDRVNAAIAVGDELRWMPEGPRMHTLRLRLLAIRPHGPGADIELYEELTTVSLP